MLHSSKREDTAARRRRYWFESTVELVTLLSVVEQRRVLDAIIGIWISSCYNGAIEEQGSSELNEEPALLHLSSIYALVAQLAGGEWFRPIIV